jgi:hypothetical protein
MAASATAYLRTHDAISMVPPARSMRAGIYTCPLHPQICQVGRGNCPVCGMTLERRLAGTIAFAEALPSDHKGTPSERSVILCESTNGGRKPGKNAIHPHR